MLKQCALPGGLQNDEAKSVPKKSDLKKITSPAAPRRFGGIVQVAPPANPADSRCGNTAPILLCYDCADAETAVFRSAMHPFELVSNFADRPLRTCWDMIRRGAQKTSPDRSYLAFRPTPDVPYRWLSYNQMGELAYSLGRGLDALGCCHPTKFTAEELCIYPTTDYNGAESTVSGSPGEEANLAIRPLGIYSKNRVEWFVAELAANLNALTLVPLYDTLGGAAMEHILQQTQMSTVLCDFNCFSSLISLLLKLKAHSVREVIVTPQDSCDHAYHFYSRRGTRIARHRGPLNEVTGEPLLCTSSADDGLDVVFDRGGHSGNTSGLFCTCPQCGASAVCWTFEKFYTPLQQAQELGVRVFTFGAVLDTGLPSLSEWSDDWPRNFMLLESQATIDTLQTICYTSGTTGAPKGVLLRHRELIAMVSGLMRVIFTATKITLCDIDCHISYLPLAHIFERVVSNIAVVASAHIGIFSGDIRNLVSDLQALRPTVMIAVPKVMERIVSGVNVQLSQKPKPLQQLFMKALAAKMDRIRKNPSDVNHLIYDKIFFSKVRASSGGRIKWVICGGAPLSYELALTTSALLSCEVIQGYGMTETLAVSAVTMPGIQPDSVGMPSPTVEIKLRSVPEMGYNVCDSPLHPKGELLIRGPSVCSGYLGGGEASRQLFLWDPRYCPFKDDPSTEPCSTTEPQSTATDGDEDGCASKPQLRTPRSENGGLPALSLAQRLLRSVGSPQVRRNLRVSPRRRKPPTSADDLLRMDYFDGNSPEELTNDLRPWLITGDIAQLDLEAGVIRIIDRRKNLLKMSQGEYVAPEKLEGLYQRRLPSLAQIFVHADGTQSQLVAIVTLNWEIAASQLGVDEDTLREDYESYKSLLKKKILNDLDTAAKVEKLTGFERIKNVHVTTIDFSPESGLLTPTMKLKRHELRQFFRKELCGLYEELRRLS